VTNFGSEPVALPEGTVVLASAALVETAEGVLLPGDATAWVTV
jgi:alpha-glucosidase